MLMRLGFFKINIGTKCGLDNKKIDDTTHRQLYLEKHLKVVLKARHFYLNASPA